MKRIILLIWILSLLLISSSDIKSTKVESQQSNCSIKLKEKCYKDMMEIKKSINLFLSHREHARNLLKEGFNLEKEIIYDLKKIIYRKIEALKNLIYTK